MAFLSLLYIPFYLSDHIQLLQALPSPLESNVQCVGWRFEDCFLQEREEEHIKKSNAENEKDNTKEQK